MQNGGKPGNFPRIRKGYCLKQGPRDQNLCSACRASWAGWNRSAPEGFCGVGRRRAQPVSGNTGKSFDEPTTKKNPALRVALRRAPAVSPRSTVLPIRSSRGSWRIASPQRNAVDSTRPNLLSPAQKLAGAGEASKTAPSQKLSGPITIGLGAASSRQEVLCAPSLLQSASGTLSPSGATAAR